MTWLCGELVGSNLGALSEIVENGIMLVCFASQTSFLVVILDENLCGTMQSTDMSNYVCQQFIAYYVSFFFSFYSVCWNITTFDVCS